MRWLSVDPGDMTGWHLWEDATPLDGGQTPNWTFVDWVADALKVTVDSLPVEGSGPFVGIELIVCEDFILYPWIIAEGGLDFDGVDTARVIGALTILCRIANVPLVLQGADIKDRAEAGGAKELFYRPIKDNRHVNDAVRHGVYYVQTELLKPGKNARVERGRLVPYAT